jgi:hypothetical protein
MPPLLPPFISFRPLPPPAAAIAAAADAVPPLLPPFDCFAAFHALHNYCHCRHYFFRHFRHIFADTFTPFLFTLSCFCRRCHYAVMMPFSPPLFAMPLCHCFFFDSPLLMPPPADAAEAPSAMRAGADFGATCRRHYASCHCRCQMPPRQRHCCDSCRHFRQRPPLRDAAASHAAFAAARRAATPLMTPLDFSFSPPRRRRRITPLPCLCAPMLMRARRALLRCRFYADAAQYAACRALTLAAQASPMMLPMSDAPLHAMPRQPPRRDMRGACRAAPP